MSTTCLDSETDAAYSQPEPVRGISPGVDHLFFGMQAALDTRAKPYGAERLELFVAYDWAPSGHSQLPPRDCRHIRSYRRNPIMVQHDPNETGKPTYWARWAGFNDDVGPWSLPCSMALAARDKAQEHARQHNSEADACEPMRDGCVSKRFD